MDVQIIIFLIHGTFARGAGWTRPDSFFRIQLTKDLNSLGYRNVHFEVFDWSGGNTHMARREASVCFERVLRSSIRNHPGSRHFVVAHSHGGNIALRAIRRSRNFSQQLVGVVTLATPFLRFTRVRSSFVTHALFSYGFAKTIMSFAYMTIILPIQLFFMSVAGLIAPVFDVFSKDKSLRNNAIFGLMFFLLIVLLIFLSVWLAGLLIEHWGPTPGHWIGGLFSYIFNETVGGFVTSTVNLVLLTIGVLFILSFAYSGGKDEVSWERLREIIRQRRQIFRRFTYIQPGSSIRDPVLSLSSGIDEALGVLTGVWMMHRLTSWFVRTVLIVLVTGLMTGTAYALYQWTTWMTEQGENNWSTAFLWETGNEIVLLLGFLVIAWVVWGVIKILGKLAGYSSIGLGMANPDYNLLLRVHAQRHPGSGDNVERKRYSFKEVIEGSSGLLFHSRLYSHPRVINKIAVWMHRNNIKGDGVIE